MTVNDRKQMSFFLVQCNFIITSVNGFRPTTGVVAFTMKPKGMDVDESQVYQELLCFSSNSQHDWPSTEKVSVVCNLKD